MKILVALVDDNPQLLQSTAQLLECFEEISLIFTAQNGQETLEKLTTQTPDIILMDIEMPVMDGIATTKAVRALYPSIKIVMLTVFAQDNKIFEAILAGANGYLMKDEKPRKIMEAIEDALEGGAPMSSMIAAKALNLIKSPFNKMPEIKTVPPKDFDLTRREIEILELLSNGLEYREIAEKLFISPATTRKHIENTYLKLQVHSKMEAVQVGIKNHWFNLIF